MTKNEAFIVLFNAFVKYRNEANEIEDENPMEIEEFLRGFNTIFTDEAYYKKFMEARQNKNYWIEIELAYRKLFF